MQKGNGKKIIGLILAFVIFVCISLTYISTGSFNLFSFAKSTALMFSEVEEKVFDKEYISSNQIITVSEPNGVGAISHNYSLSFEDLPQKVVSVSIDFDKSKESVGGIALKVVTEEKDQSYTISNTSIIDSTKLIQVGVRFVNSAKITSQYDAYGGTTISNEEIVSISSVKFNNTDDIDALKNKFFVDFIKSIVFSAVVLLIVLFVVKSKVDDKIFKGKFCIEKLFLFSAIIVGLIFSFLLPIYQVPDEQTHINIMYEELNWDVNIKTQSDISDFADTTRIVRNYDEKVNIATYFNSEIVSPLPSAFALPSIKIIRHIPQAIGFVFTTLLRLPLWVCVSFAEIFALLTYAFLGYFTIKIMPFKKEVMTAIMLLPVCLQEFPSLSYDSFLLATYFLLLAYILYVKFTKEKFTFFDVLIILLLTFVIVITKIPYALVFGLILIIPISKIDFNFGLFRLTGDFIKKHKVVFSICAVVCAIVAIALGVKAIPYISEGKTFLAAVHDIGAAFKLIRQTTEEYFGEMIIQITGDLGWFDTPVALSFTVFVAVNILLLNLFDCNGDFKKINVKKAFKFVEILLFFVVAAGMSIITILSMFGWTLKAYGIDVDSLSVAEMSDYMGRIPCIGGIQGRYFVPVMPLFIIPCCFPKVSECINKINTKTYLCGYHMFVFVYLIVILLNRYWI